jgi:hypothetical protein
MIDAGVRWLALDPGGEIIDGAHGVTPDSAGLPFDKYGRYRLFKSGKFLDAKYPNAAMEWL